MALDALFFPPETILQDFLLHKILPPQLQFYESEVSVYNSFFYGLKGLRWAY